MSKPAWEYLTSHLPEIRRTVLPNTGSKLGEPGLALLLYLSGQANKKGEFFMTAKTMQDETDIATLRQVEKLLAGFIALGWITPTGETVSYMERGRPTPVYLLTLFPEYAQQFARTVQKSDDIPSGDTVEKATKPNKEKTLQKNTLPEPEPEPEPQPEPGSGLGAGGWGKEHDQLLSDILACEDLSKDNGKLQPWLVKAYKPLIVRALRDRPAPDLVAWCLDMRQGREHKAEFERQPCPVCNDQIFHGTGDPLDGQKALWAGQELGWVPCTNCQPWLVNVS